MATLLVGKAEGGLFHNPRWQTLRQVDASTARRSISDLIRDSERGDRVIITRNGKPAVAVVPLGDLALLLDGDTETERRMVEKMSARQPVAKEQEPTDSEMPFETTPPTTVQSLATVEGDEAAHSKEAVLRLAVGAVAGVLGSSVAQEMCKIAVEGVMKRIGPKSSLNRADERRVEEEVLASFRSKVEEFTEAERLFEASGAG